MTEPDKTPCRKKVYHGPVSYPCRNKAKPGQAFCGVHESKKVDPADLAAAPLYEPEATASQTVDTIYRASLVWPPGKGPMIARSYSNTVGSIQSMRARAVNDGPINIYYSATTLKKDGTLGLKTWQDTIYGFATLPEPVQTYVDLLQKMIEDQKADSDD